jgi:hypothetical protein
MVQAALSPQGVASFHSVMEAPAKGLVKSIVHAPKDFRAHIHQFVVLSFPTVYILM